MDKKDRGGWNSDAQLKYLWQRTQGKIAQATPITNNGASFGRILFAYNAHQFSLSTGVGKQAVICMLPVRTLDKPEF